MKKLLSFLLLSVAILITSCEDNNSDTGDGSTSGSSSHNTGKNCLGCHGFKAAGSVYKQALTSVYSGATIRLTSGANGTGTLLATLTSDKSGNYYTSNSINFGTGIYVGVTGSGGTVKYMSAAIRGGACNSCHNGSATSKVWAE